MIQSFGPHKVTNVSVESPLVDQMLAGSRVSILYSDPPWGDGNLKYWVAMNKKMSGREFTAISYETLVARFRDLIQRYVDGHVLIETGVRWEQETVAMIQPLVHRIRTFRLLYRSGSVMLENSMIVGVTDPGYPDMPFDPTGLHGYQVPKGCIQSIATAGGVPAGGIVLDPCCGMGYTAKAAVNAGMVFRGNEFNPVRLAKTIRFLERAVQRSGRQGSPQGSQQEDQPHGG